MKRRRAEMAQHHTESADTAPEIMLPKRKRPKLDVLEAARKHREEEEQQREAEQDERPPDEEDVDVDQLKNLAIVEEMDMPLRKPSEREEESTERWDDQWNGRKNFKKFRRKGEARSRPRMQAVIVPLEEVTRKEYGVGENYWSSNSHPANTRVDSDEGDRVGESIEIAPSRSEQSVPMRNSPAPTSEPTPPRRQKRARDSRDSDSDDGTRFRFKRKR
jgi:hypothetical protein